MLFGSSAAWISVEYLKNYNKFIEKKKKKKKEMWKVGKIKFYRLLEIERKNLSDDDKFKWRKPCKERLKNIKEKN